MMKVLSLTALLLTNAFIPVTPQLASFDFVARTYHAAGYSDTTESGKPNLLGFGLGALEQISYDSTEKIVYTASEMGFVTVIDFSNGPAAAEQAPFAIAFENTLTDVEVCGGFLFVASKDDPNNGMVSIYTTAKQGADGTISEPEFIQNVEVGVGPDMIYPNPTCDILGVANEGEGEYEDSLLDPVGSVSLIKAPFDGTVEVVQVSLDNWTDEELIALGVHMPLPLNALEYWDEHSAIASDLDFASARANYEPASNLEPEYLAWSEDGSTLFVNLQENCALVTVDVASGTTTNIFSYGLKDWSMIGIDVVEDGTFSSEIVEGLYTTRSPDSIASFSVNGETYIITANEGDDKEYGDYEERLKAADIFNGAELAMLNATADVSVFDPANVASGSSKHFNDECDETNPATPFCSGSMRLSVGSSMVDYTDPQSPNIFRLVGLGGRGISIYKVTPSKMTLVWDSADKFERKGYEAFPWAHNGIQDEEFAPVGGVAYELADAVLREAIEEVNAFPDGDGCEGGGDGQPGACPLGQTVDDTSLKNGPAAEAVVVGEACGSRFAVTASEKNSIGFLYNLDDVMSPELEKVFHLSEASETLNPGVAYEARSLGEIDSESIVFLDASKSPTSKAAVMFAGAWSGTLSYWEFTCVGDTAPATPAPTPTGTSTPPTDSSATTAPTATSTPPPTTDETNAPSFSGSMTQGLNSSAASRSMSLDVLLSAIAVLFFLRLQL